MGIINDTIQAISDNRFWMLFLVFFVAAGMLGVEIKDIFKTIIEEME